MNDKQLPLVTFEQAKRLKAAGFDWPVIPYYTFSGILVDGLACHEKMADGKYPTFYTPTVALALQWMRNVKNIHYEVGVNQYCYEPPLGSPFNARYNYRYTFKAYKDGKKVASRGNAFQIQDAPYKSHESAESALLDELLTIL
jgi:hypothetical protein